MVSVGVSKLWKTTFFFIELNVEVDVDYRNTYRNELMIKMLPKMRARADDCEFIFQQDGARAHTSSATIEYLHSYRNMLWNQ